MTLFLKQGDKFKVSSTAALDLHEKLPVGTYTVGIECNGGLYLQSIDDFTVPKRMYGNTTRHADRILTTFLQRSAVTGVLLNGEKGSGKTLLAKCIARQAAEQHEVPTIVINRNLYGEDFNTFLQAIQQPTIILLDEFEKVYSKRHEQQAMLTLLDGVYPSKKLFLLTCNDKYRIDSHLRNRPGRIFYMLDFNGLSPEFIQEYASEKLLPEHLDHISEIVAVSAMFDAFNFDMLQAMVEDMNRYGESPSEVLQFLNIRPEFSEDCTYLVKLFYKNKELGYKNGVQKDWYGNPLMSKISLSYAMEPDGDEDEGAYRVIEFTTKDLLGMNGNKGVYTFQNKDNERLVLTRQKPSFQLDLGKLVVGPKMQTTISESASDKEPESPAMEITE